MNSLNLRRLGLLMRNDLYLHRRAIIIAVMTIVGVQLFHGLTSYSYVKKYGFDPYNFFLFGGGYLVTAFAFRSLHTNTSAMLYLLTPASMLEKYLSRYLLTSLGFMLAVTLVYSGADLGARELNYLIYQEHFDKFYPFHAVYPDYLLLYFISHAFVFWCALFFRKYTLIKIILVFLVLFLMIDIYMSIWLDHITGVVIGLFSTLGGLHAPPPVQEQNFVLSIADVIMWELPFIDLPLIAVTAPLFWILGYLRLKKSER
jgi:hypothetical protein